MRKSGIIRRRDGFTLVELIVVLVIIGILLAFIVPNLTGYIDKAQATSCRKNRAELQKIYRYNTLLAEADGTATTMSAVLGSENGKKLTCPSGGTYRYNESTGHLVCSNSKHNVGNFGMSPIDAGVLDVIETAGITKDMNSGATNDANTIEFKAALQEAGLDFDAMGIKSWAYHANNAIYWTAVDISTLNVGDTVPVMKYVTTDKPANHLYKGVYSVWNIKVKQVNGYNILDESLTVIGNGQYEFPDSKNIAATDANKKDYDRMYEIYQQELAKYNASH